MVVVACTAGGLVVACSGNGDSPASIASNDAVSDASAEAGGDHGADVDNAEVITTDDSSPPLDGSADSSTEGEASKPFVCAPNWFCDDFESGLKANYKTTTYSGGTVVVDATRPKSGKSSLHVRSPAKAYSDAEVNLGKPAFPAMGNHYFARVFVYYAPPSAPDNVYLFRVDGTLPMATTRVNAQLGHNGNPYNQPTAPGFKHLASWIYHSDTASANHAVAENTKAPAVTYGAWACWEFEVDGAANQWHVWIDGVEHLNISWNGMAGTPWVVPITNTLSIGIRHPHDEPVPVEVWFDDLVIADKRVGCG
ncbi:MAG: hypothetical protein NVS3B20_01690 [Polyangiales bacterium]